MFLAAFCPSKHKNDSHVRKLPCALLTARSPDMLAPAKIPVAAGKKMENTEKKDWPSLNSGWVLVRKVFPIKNVLSN